MIVLTLPLYLLLQINDCWCLAVRIPAEPRAQPAACIQGQAAGGRITRLL